MSNTDHFFDEFSLDILDREKAQKEANNMRDKVYMIRCFKHNKCPYCGHKLRHTRQLHRMNLLKLECISDKCAGKVKEVTKGGCWFFRHDTIKWTTLPRRLGWYNDIEDHYSIYRGVTITHEEPDYG